MASGSSSNYVSLIKDLEKAQRKRDYKSMRHYFLEVLNGLLEDPDVPEKQRNVYERMDDYFEVLLSSKWLSTSSLASMGNLHGRFRNESKSLKYYDKYWQRTSASFNGGQYKEVFKFKFSEQAYTYTKHMHQFGKDESALTTLSATLDIFEQRNLPRKEEYSKLTHCKGKSLFYLHNYAEALKAFKRGKKLMMNCCPAEDAMISDIYHDLGLAHSKVGNHERAIEFLTKVLDAKTKNYENDIDEKMLRINLSFEIADDYFRHRKHAKCLEHLMEFKKLYKLKFAKTFLDKAKMVSEYFDKCYEALNLDDIDPFLYHPNQKKMNQEADELLGKAKQCLNKYQFKKAIDLAIKAKDIKTEVYRGKIPPGLVIEIHYLIAVGRADSLSFERKLYSREEIKRCEDEVHKNLQFGLDVFERYKQHFDEDHIVKVQIPNMLLMKAQYYSDENYHDECIAYAKKAFEMTKTDGDMKHANDKQNLFFIGDSYFSTKRYGEALVYLNRVKNLLKESKNDNDEKLWHYCETLILIAKCRIARKEYDDAMMHIDEASQLSKQATNPSVMYEIHGKATLDLIKCMRKKDVSMDAAALMSMASMALNEVSPEELRKVKLFCKGYTDARADRALYAILCSAQVDCSPLKGECGGELQALVVSQMNAMFQDQMKMLYNMNIQEGQASMLAIVSYAMRNALLDEDVHELLDILKKNTSMPEYRLHQFGFERYRSSAHICQFIREKTKQEYGTSYVKKRVPEEEKVRLHFTGPQLIGWQFC